ncbi:1-acyl-sn-glycerol-3-phosphate acyltransferase [Propionicimonas sp.]|uniref:1-acyl-sn-glycerol-3-phosphate acyltransferase n=1 Tax=Propionicimonas sp. TaxID=1955623 RepID=UPI0017FD5FD8|nr:1-acyl-sn-glycerol-3-phosphate acyltransferase [Propionicimonas sp.]MBU3976089.1 1-acyl-sn-glycerol-3-phosphate acyltransferase [Actinomycetota bacterium]MBA3020902.1 acyl-phosphate glycerol 3-phosphate acyltransferase [Propionicimonas sp.]MBU3985279.1 1-acyl-sn-glycerol-3-phosphate acyltransferase [Actinomycetota bacterium]MBU4008269.1 1-acyl-sn-glycerol-3-phosphate acyltransferase [Actinomycetota bacterium]MBU4064517.1 1-acyl-sn-glycerol-3-phosphate acyltransferase [Actinomycetota bacteri
MIRKGIAAIFWRFSRWTLRNDPQPDVPRILIGAPHTSNWDFVLMLAICWQSGVSVKWLGKHTLFTSWRGPIMRALGGIPVNRDNPGRIVDEVLELQKKGSFSIAITPEGTRSARKQWKSGFYRIAQLSGLPITLGYVDRTTMTTGLGLTFNITGDPKTDMDVIRAFYADKSGFYPDRTTVPRLAIENQGR